MHIRCTSYIVYIHIQLFNIGLLIRIILHWLKKKCSPYFDVYLLGLGGGVGGGLGGGRGGPGPPPASSSRGARAAAAPAEPARTI